jgi:hypothetical protein
VLSFVYYWQAIKFILQIILMKRNFTRILTVFCCLSFVFLSTSKSFSQLPRPDHIVVCIMENHPYTGINSSASIFGNSAAPYINALAHDSNAANFTNAHAIEHPSQPNYLDFFSGSNQGVTSDAVPSNYPFITDNLASQLIDSALTFATFSEDLPYVGFDRDTGSYKRKHNPVTNWVGSFVNQVPATTNQPLTAFPSPTGYDSLPTVSYVVPNQDNDMHNGSDPARIALADTWMQNHLDAYIQWAKTHNSLFILTFDEDDGLSTTFDNRIVTIFSGEMVKTGQYTESINHYTVLRTIEDMYGLRHAGNAANKTAITDCWLSIPTGVQAISDAKPVWRVYPNPVSSYLKLESAEAGDAASEVYISDVAGRMVSHYSLANTKSLAVNTSAYSPGLYFYRIMNGAGRAQEGRFVAQ